MLGHIFDYYIIRVTHSFDRYYYLKENEEIRKGDIDPLWHFVRNGWREYRNPSIHFDTSYYLDVNPEIHRDNINPLIHYIWVGKWEGRKPFEGANTNINGESASKFMSAIHYYFHPAIYYFRAHGFKELIKKVSIKFIRTILGRHDQKIGQSNISFSNSFFPLSENYCPKVSIIVPNYNHSKFLKERLESIYNQTYKNIEVLLLDDGSTDDSRNILKSYEEKYPQNTNCYFNENNSGSPFAQWKYGFSLATGDLIWIAESDDFCDTNFLEKLVPYFADESILLSYAHSIFVDHSGKKHKFAFEHYVSQINENKWKASYIETAHKEVNSALGILNTIPNVSSVVFRKMNKRFALFDDPAWQQMKVCGDWLFYLNLIRGGRIAFCQETHSYYRIHHAGISKKSQTEEIYYKEHEIVGGAVAELYNVPVSLLERLHKRVKDFYFDNVRNGSEEQFSGYFDLKKLLIRRGNRKPNVLIATYAFAFGGGEIFPIQLANALLFNGVGVTFFNGCYEPTQSGVRKMLAPQIPVINNFLNLNLNSMLSEFGIEIIHTHHASMENLFAKVKITGANDFKHVATMHGMYEMMVNFINDTRYIRNSVDHWFYTTDKNIIPFQKNDVYFETKFSKFENGMQTPEFHDIDLTPLGITPDSFTICLASRALPDKGWKEAIEATGKAREITNKDVHLILIGEGVTFDELKINDQPRYVHLLGYKANLDDYLMSSQLGLIPSYFKGESFPLVMIQCFMAGIPVVATRIGEIERMITAENHKIGGLLIELRNGKIDSMELADAIIKMISDENYYQECKNTVQKLKERFDIDNVAKLYISAYQKLLE